MVFSNNYEILLNIRDRVMYGVKTIINRGAYLHKGVFSHVEWAGPEICEQSLGAGV